LNLDDVEDEDSALDDSEDPEQNVKADAVAKEGEVAQREAIVASASSSGAVAQSMAQRVSIATSADTVGGWEAAATASRSDFSRASVNNALESGPAQFLPRAAGGQFGAIATGVSLALSDVGPLRIEPSLGFDLQRSFFSFAKGTEPVVGFADAAVTHSVSGAQGAGMLGKPSLSQQIQFVRDSAIVQRRAA
jgi:hypothetical protein